MTSKPVAGNILKQKLCEGAPDKSAISDPIPLAWLIPVKIRF